MSEKYHILPVFMSFGTYVAIFSRQKPYKEHYSNISANQKAGIYCLTVLDMGDDTRTGTGLTFG